MLYGHKVVRTAHGFLRYNECIHIKYPACTHRQVQDNAVMQRFFITSHRENFAQTIHDPEIGSEIQVLELQIGILRQHEWDIWARTMHGMKIGKRSLNAHEVITRKPDAYVHISSIQRRPMNGSSQPANEHELDIRMD